MINIVIIIDYEDPCGQEQLVSGTAPSDSDQWSLPLEAVSSIIYQSGLLNLTPFLRELKIHFQLVFQSWRKRLVIQSLANQEQFPILIMINNNGLDLYGTFKDT